MFNKENYSKALQEVIEASWFTIGDGVYVYTKVRQVTHVQDHLMIINDGEEITIVTRQENVQQLDLIEANKEKWRLINIRCGNPFYCAGFIAYITSSLAARGIDIVITSSYSNDLVLVMEKDLSESIQVLIENGFQQRDK